MRIDAHNHFWKYNAEDYGWISEDLAVLKQDFEPLDLHIELLKQQIDGTIAVQARQSLKETYWLLELAAKNEYIKGVVGWVDLKSPCVENELKALSSNPKFVGVRHVIQDESDPEFALNPNFLRGISLLSTYNLTYDILVFDSQLPQIIELVSMYPNQKFVLDHIAKPKIREHEIKYWEGNVRQLAAFKNVCCKLSGMLTEADWNNWKPTDFTPYLDVIFECFGINRLMFGSDWPVCKLAGSYSDTVDLVESYIQRNCEPSAKELIMGLNCEKFYLK